MKKSILFNTVFFLATSMTSLYAQDALVANGGNGTCAAGSVSFSIGLVNYTYQTDGNRSVTEGVQHAYEIEQTPVAFALIPQPSIIVYPNPTTDLLAMSIEEPIDNENGNNLTYELLNASGSRIMSGELRTQLSEISMKDQVGGSYYLVIRQNEQQISINKIIKH